MQSHLTLAGGRNVALLATGGTIAGLQTGQADGHYRAGQLPVQALLQALPKDAVLAAPASIRTEQVAQVDSKDMGPAIWHELAHGCARNLADSAIDGLVITHGTDTLEETAWFLQQVLPVSSKPVVLVSAMRPADSPEADGPRNLADALALAQMGASVAQAGVVAVHAGDIHLAKHVRKVHPWRLNAFSSAAEPVGHLVGAVLNWNTPSVLPAGGTHAWYLEHRQMPVWPKVALLTSHAGATPELIDALVATGFQGVVLAATGNGTVHEALLPALLKAHEVGVKVRIASRCQQGSITGSLDAEMPFEISPLQPLKARIDLALELLQASFGAA